MIVYGYVGDIVILKCFLILLVVLGRMMWRGLLLNIKYFINDNKNLFVDRGEWLFVMFNIVLGVYNFWIINFIIGVDDGMFSCEVNINFI